MKFTKENVKEKILAKLGNTRKLSDRSIDEMIATAMAFAGEETELADFLKNAEPMFVTANGNLIKEQADFVKEWELKNPKKDETKKDAPTGGLTAEQIAAILDQKLSPLQQELEGYRAERTTESIFMQAKNDFLTANKLDETNERVKLIKERVFTTVKSKVGKDSAVADITAAMKAEFDDLVKIAGVDAPYVPAESSGGGGGDKTQFEQAMKILQEQGKLPVPAQS